MRILFLSRAYPPVRGGIENHNFFLAKHLGDVADVTTITNGRGKKFLPFFLPYALFRCLWLMRTHDTLLLGDGVLAPLGALISIVFPRKKFVCILHGLDITFARKKSIMGIIYRLVNIPCLRLLDLFIMVGNRTIEEAVKAGVPSSRCVHIPNGMNASSLYRPTTRDELASVLPFPLENRKTILRIGRFVEHKGVEWFIRNVMPKLPSDTVFIAAGGRVSKSAPGDKDSFESCQKAIEDLGVEKRVALIPDAPQETIRILYNAADLYVSPNIRIPGSMEGFGINAIEAAGCGRVVVASDLDGLADAILDGKNGFLIEPGNADAYALKIRSLLEKDDYRSEFGRLAKEFTVRHFSWDGIARRYLEEIRKSKS